MKEKILYALWGTLYILCVGLGTISSAQGLGKAALVLAAVAFFVPPMILLINAGKKGNRKGILTIRILSACSLGLTLLFLVLTFVSVNMSPTAGKVFSEILLLVSAPMVCGQYYIVSLFLWACLFFGSFTAGKTMSK